MADISGASISYLVYAQTPYQPLARSISASSPQAQSLPDELSSSRFASHRTTISTGQADSMLSVSIFIAKSITGILDNLAQSANLASSSLTQTAANVQVGSGTRISVGNIQAGVDQTLDGIVSLVDKAAMGAANILSSNSNDIAVQTSIYGGTLNIAPQPFDLAGLGLENLDLHTREGRIDAAARIGQAKIVAEKRLLNLKALRNGLSDPSAMSSALNTLGASSGNVRGVLVDVSA